MTRVTRSVLAGAAMFAVMAATAGPSAAQIVPETSGQTSAANSPAAVVQTGSRRRLACPGCNALRSVADLHRFDRWDEAHEFSRSGRPVEIR